MTDQDDESRIGAYAPPSDGFETFDAREEEGRRGTFLLMVLVGILVLFVAVVWSAFNQGVRDAGSAPRILADVEPYRTRPADPGGEQTPDTGLGVYDRLTGENETSGEVSLRPTPEDPIEDTRPALRVETVGADETSPSAPDTQSDAEVTPRQAPPRTQQQAEEPETQSPAEAREQPAAPDTPAPQAEAEDPAYETPPARAAEDESTPAVRQPETPDFAPSPSGNWVVQIASFRTESDAEAAWLAFRTRFADIASGLAPDVASVEIPDRGTYHRLRIAAFASRDEAVRFCTTLQGRGQDCLVARR